MLSRAFLDERLVPELAQDTVEYFDHLRRYLLAQSYVQGKRVLDIACGTGYGSDILAKGGARHVLSFDLSAEALRYARQRWQASYFSQADALQLPLAEHSLDVIVSFETLEHLPDPQAFLAEARRVLVPQGILILSTPNRLAASPNSDSPYSPYHAFEPTLAELQALLTRAGVHIQHIYGMGYSEQARALVRPAHAPYGKNTGVAWTAYLRYGLTRLLPPALMDLLRTWRRIPRLSLADSCIFQDASDASSYFIAVCQMP